VKANEFTLIITGVMLNAIAQLLLKAGTRTIGHFEFTAANIRPIGWAIATNPYIFGGLLCYAISVVIWILALSRVEVSMAYPMLSLGYVVNAFFGWWLFGEAVTALRMGGIGFIIVGVYLVAKS
jgi:multidrug transporter EmrE-like cation transporter